MVDALRALPFQQRETVALFYLGDLSTQEIATTLSVAEVATDTRAGSPRGLLQTTVEADRG